MSRWRAFLVALAGAIGFWQLLWSTKAKDVKRRRLFFGMLNPLAHDEILHAVNNYKRAGWQLTHYGEDVGSEETRHGGDAQLSYKRWCGWGFLWGAIFALPLGLVMGLIAGLLL